MFHFSNGGSVYGNALHRYRPGYLPFLYGKGWTGQISGDHNAAGAGYYPAGARNRFELQSSIASVHRHHDGLVAAAKGVYLSR